MARGRLKGALNNIVEDPDTSNDMSKSMSGRVGKRLPKMKEGRDSMTHKPYVIKLFDRLVNVSRYDEDSPLYPICRDWFYDRKKEVEPEEPPPEGRTYYTGRESLVRMIQKGRLDRVAALPPPLNAKGQHKYPICEPPALENGLNLITPDYVSACLD